MPSIAPSASAEARGDARLEVLFEELAELCGQRNAIDGRIVDIAAEIERDELWGGTGARSVAALLAWKTGVSPGNAHTIATVAHRADEFPRCVQGMREGRVSLDEVGVIAGRAADGSDEHYAQLAGVATVNSCAPRSNWNRDPNPITGLSRRARSPRPATSRVAAGGSNSITSTRRSSMRHCGVIWTP